MRDLGLAVLIETMANGDEFLHRVAEEAFLSAPENDLKSILYRQDVLKDCLKQPDVIRQIYALSIEAIEGTKKRWWHLSSAYASSLLYEGIEMLEVLSGILRKLRAIALEQGHRFRSQAFTALFGMLNAELGDDYLESIRDCLAELKFRHGVLLSAHLGPSNESMNLRLRKLRYRKPGWRERIFGRRPPGYTFHLAERDEAGARILSDMRQRGIGRVAIALAESADHVLSFFRSLRAELAFYIGCLNLHSRLLAFGEPVCFPAVAPEPERRHRFTGLYDVSLSLQKQGAIVGNSADADGTSLIIITGANQGGKSSFLRSIGLAQLMMQAGMFVAADSFSGNVCSSLFTHYKREEDASLESGKFDEELARISAICDSLRPNSLLLFNESFAATNEREGSEIARQIVQALLDKGMKIFFVTHLYPFARSFYDRGAKDTMFLRAERKPDGTRTFRMLEGEPQQTSYGRDLYRAVFEVGKSDEGLHFAETR